MTISCASRTAFCLLVLSGSASAQKNPFGGSDPFGNASTKRSNVAQGTTMPKSKKQAALQFGSAEDRIRHVLAEKTSQSFIELPLSDVIQQLSQSHEIPILVDLRALEEVGLSTEEPINLSLKDVSLRSFLRLALTGLDLTYTIRDEVLVITTHEAAEKTLTLETYTFPEALTEKTDKVLAGLQSTVKPDMWNSQGGPCDAAVIDNVLIVSGPETVHVGIVDFLRKLEAALNRGLAHNSVQ